MNLITPLKERLIQLRQGLLLQLLIQVISENLTVAEDIITDQLEKGLDGNGDLITPQLRSETYARLKKFAGGKAPFGTPDLKNTGSFHRRITASIRGTTLVFTSTDPKTSMLIQKYGQEIFFLNDQSRELIAEELAIPGLIFGVERFLLS